MIRRPYVLLCLALSVFSSCTVRPPTTKELVSADYGTEISQEEAERIAKDWFHNTLKDPASARYEWGSVGQGWIREAPLYGSKLRFGYRLEVQVNAKNSYGGYTGFKQYLFLFRNGRIVRVWKESKSKYGHKSFMLRVD